MIIMGTMIHHTYMCFMIPLYLVRDAYLRVMHNAYMQVLDSLYVLVDNSRLDLAIHRLD